MPKVAQETAMSLECPGAFDSPAEVPQGVPVARERLLVLVMLVHLHGLGHSLRGHFFVSHFVTIPSDHLGGMPHHWRCPPPPGGLRCEGDAP